MASPQLENGYTRLANEVIEALMRTNLSAYQSRILWAIWRRTYGWHRTEDSISNKLLTELTGLPKSHISRTVSELTERNMVTRIGNKIAFNKDYQSWRELPKRVTLPGLVTIVTDWGYRKLPNGVTTSRVEATSTGPDDGLKKGKKYNKETYTRFFEEFWNTYPVRNGKKLEKAETFRRYCTLPESDLPLCNEAVKNYANSEGIKKGIGIKDPKRFLKDGFWREWIEPEKTPGNSEASYIDRVKGRMGL